ncbi:hypothetical protein ACP70R_007632 [Stipagrostis hirtigluma subsp. patula]
MDLLHRSSSVRPNLPCRGPSARLGGTGPLYTSSGSGRPPLAKRRRAWPDAVCIAAMVSVRSAPVHGACRVGRIPRSCSFQKTTRAWNEVYPWQDLMAVAATTTTPCRPCNRRSCRRRCQTKI